MLVSVAKNPSQSAYQALDVIREHMPEVMDKHGLRADALIEKYLVPLLNATRHRCYTHKGKVKTVVEEEALEIRRDALHMALRIRGDYAPPPVEQAHKHTVQVLVLDSSLRPKRDFPPPTMIEIAPNNGNGTNGGKV
jgi:hypothetical protein